MQDVISRSTGPTTAPEGHLHAWKVAIELRDITMLFAYLGLSQQAPRQLLLSAVRALHENFNRAADQRRDILFDTLLFQRLPEKKRESFATALLDLQERFYLQRLIDLLDE